MVKIPRFPYETSIMKRLFPVLFAFFCFIAPPREVAGAEPPNFVWIIADDMSPDIAAYGDKGVKTPNLDWLAREGKRYDRAYATAPVCSSSRSAFILGCYQTTTGLHPHDAENPQSLPAPFWKARLQKTEPSDHERLNWWLEQYDLK